MIVIKCDAHNQRSKCNPRKGNLPPGAGSIGSRLRFRLQFRCEGDIDGFNRAMEKHFFENTQACISKDSGWIQDGVHYDAENFEAFCNEVMRVILAVRPDLVMDKYRKEHLNKTI